MANISTLGQSLDQIARLKTQQTRLDDLTFQITSGKKTSRFAGLGNDVLQSQRARAGITSLEVYLDNIKNAQRKIDLMDNSLNEIREQSNIILNSLTVSNKEGDFPDLETIQATARNVLNYIESLVNTQDGERYLFAGADSSERPLEDTGLLSSFLGEYIPDATNIANPPITASGLIGQWGDGTITTDQFIQTYKGTPENVIGYSNSLSTDSAGKVFVRVDDNTELDYTVLGDADPIKDIVIALNVLVSLPPVSSAPGALNDPTATTLSEDIAPFPPEEKQQNFHAVITDLMQMLSGAAQNLETEEYKLGLVQAQMKQIQENTENDIGTFQGIVGDVEDIDLNEAAAKIQQLQVQMEASYRVTSLLSQLSIVNFL